MARATKKAKPARERKVKPATRGYGEKGKAKHDPAKHPRDANGRFVSKGGGAAARPKAAPKPKAVKPPKEPKPKAPPKPPRKIGTAKQRKGLADQIREAKAKATTPEARKALLTQVRDLRAKRKEWKRGQGKTQVEKLPKPPKPPKPKKEKAPKPPGEAKPKVVKEKAPKPPKEPKPKAEPKPKVVKEKVVKGKPSKGEAVSPSHHEQMAARVKVEVERLKGEFATAKAKLAAAEAEVAGLSPPEKYSPRGWAVKEAARAAYREADALAERGKRLKAWEKDVQSNPDLIPAFPMAERLAIYAERGGRAKVEALAKLGGDREAMESRLAEVTAARDLAHRKFWDTPIGAKGYEEAERDLYRLNAERRALETKLTTGATDRAEVARVLAPKGKTLAVEAAPGDAGRPDVAPLGPSQRPAVDKGLEFIRSVTADAGTGGMKVAVGRVADQADDRSNCTSGGIALDDRAGPDVMVHEFGHYLEEHTGAGASALDFLKHRVGDEKPRPMQDVNPGAKYKAHEMGRKDRFDRAFSESQAYYVGKDYGRGGTEITSMGLQKLHNDAANFAKKDPEYALFVCGILDGSLR